MYTNQLNINCNKCFDLVRSRKKITWGYGNVKSSIIFIGEAPGRLGCDITGIPFTKDKSGELFQEMLKSIGLTKEDIYTTNIVKCCPKENDKNRSPTKNEIINCLPYLREEIANIPVKILVLLGRNAVSLFFPNFSLSILSHWNDNLIYKQYQIIILPHPAYICRNENLRDRYRMSFSLIKGLL